MLVKKGKKIKEFLAGDYSILKELLHPEKDGIELGYSIAMARINPGATTLKHRLKSSEVYYILQGRGIMHIDKESSMVEKGDLIYIPPASTQRIENTGDEELVFLCIVSPPWKKEDEEILE